MRWRWRSRAARGLDTRAQSRARTPRQPTAPAPGGRDVDDDSRAVGNGVTELEPLIDVLVHTHDLAWPLGAHLPDADPWLAAEADGAAAAVPALLPPAK
jgi:hypothetical protein